MCATTQATLKYVTGLARGHSLHWVRNIDNVKLHRTRPGHSAAGNEFLCKATPTKYFMQSLPQRNSNLQRFDQVNKLMTSTELCASVAHPKRGGYAVELLTDRIA